MAHILMMSELFPFAAKKCNCGCCRGVQCAFTGPNKGTFSGSEVFEWFSGVVVRRRLTTRVRSVKEHTVHSWEVRGVTAMAIVPNSPRCMR